MTNSTKARARKGAEPNRLKSGKGFHRAMRREWEETAEGTLRFEKTIDLERRGRENRCRRGRMDLLIEEIGDYVSVVEFKRTDWDRMRQGRIRPNALRHAAQVWSYVDHYVDDGVQACPGVVYAKEPRKPGRRALVEEILNGKLIQVVWNRERDNRRC